MPRKFSVAILFISFLLEPALGQQHLQLTDIWASPKFYARVADNFRSMNDGLHYSNTTEESDKGVSILSYAFASGNVKDTILPARHLYLPTSETVTPIKFEDYKFSRDESRLLLSTDAESINRYSSKANFYVYSRVTGKMQMVSPSGKQQYADFSPDGRKVAFVRDNNLFITDLVTGNESAITSDGKRNQIINGSSDWVNEEEFALTQSFFWSENGNYLAYFKFDESDVKEFSFEMYDGLYPTMITYKYPKAGEANSKVDIYMYEVATGKNTKVELGERGDDYLPRIKWTRDDTKLCVTKMNRLQNKLELYLVDAPTAKGKKIFTEVSKSFIEITDDLYFLDNKKQFVWTSNMDGYYHIYLYNLDGSLAKQITKGSWDVTRFYGYSESIGKYFYQAAQKSALERQVYAIDSRGKTSLLSQTDGTNDASFSNNFKYMSLTYSKVDKPFYCTLRETGGKDLRVLEDNSDVNQSLALFDLQPVEFFNFTTDEQVNLNAFMIKPPNFDATKKYPVLMYMYGGPGSQALPTQTVLDQWDGPTVLWMKMLAQRGYLIVSVDNRGTAARGRDFNAAIYGQLGKLETEDQAATCRYLTSLPYVDKNRIGAWGWSYGGYLSALLITKHPDLFKMAVSVAPVTNWRFYDSIYAERYLGLPQDNPKGYDDNSPINFTRALTGKLLLIHGTADDNVHFQNSMEFVNKLVKDKKQVDVFFYPNRNHGIYGGGATMHIYTKITDYILNNL